jgi:putative sterol carrier protein
MSLEDVTAAIRAKAATSPSLGHRIQFDLGADGVIYWDGSQTPPVIDNSVRDAETTIAISLDDLQRLITGALNPTMAYMTGKLKVQGSMGIALKMSQLLED